MHAVKRICFFLVAALLLQGQPFSLAPLCAEEMKIVAIVNDEVITQADLNRALAPVYLQMQATYKPQEMVDKAKEVKDRVLQQLIEERLMLQEARSPHAVEVAKGKVGTPPSITVSDNEVEEMISEAMAKFQDQEAFSEVLNQQGLTLEDLKIRYKDQIIIQKLIDREIRSRIVVSPMEVTEAYEKRLQEFEVPPAVQAAVLVVKPKDLFDVPRARDLANGLSQQLKNGADFYDLTKRYSDGPNSKMGGRLGFLEKGKSIPEIDQALFSLKVGEISPVISTPQGFYIFKVESIRPRRQATLTEVQTQIQEKLFREKMAARYEEWIKRLREKAYIDVQDVEVSNHS